MHLSPSSSQLQIHLLLPKVSLSSVFGFTMASTRQLFELLEEKQEPFLLDVYLQQNGCSSLRLQRLSSRVFKRRGAAVGFLKSLLTKLVHGKPFSKALSFDSKKTIESGRFSVFSCFSGISSRELGGDHQWRCIEMDDGKQLSPVSVLEFYNHSFKEENQSSTSSSFDSPREAPETSTTFTHHTKYSSKGQQLLFDCAREAEERVCDHRRNCLNLEIRAQAIHEKLLSWKRMQGDASSLTKLLSSDMAESRNEWSKFRPEVEELGVEIESAIFDEIVDETVLEILGTHCT